MLPQADIYRLLLDSGFAAPVLIDHFDLQRRTPLNPDLETHKEFVVMAEKQ